MSKPEDKDLAELQEKLNSLARAAMDAMRDSSTASADMLPHMGHKTNADAVLSTYLYYQKQMDAALKAHLKKYPD